MNFFHLSAKNIYTLFLSVLTRRVSPFTGYPSIQGLPKGPCQQAETRT